MRIIWIRHFGLFGRVYTAAVIIPPDDTFQQKFIKDSNWTIEENCITVDDIESNISYFKYFAGDMQKIFQKAKHFYSLRLMKISLEIGEHKKKLIREDLIKSIEFLKLNSNITDLDNDIIYRMYS